MQSVVCPEAIQLPGDQILLPLRSLQDDIDLLDCLRVVEKLLHPVINRVLLDPFGHMRPPLVALCILVTKHKHATDTYCVIVNIVTMLWCDYPQPLLKRLFFVNLTMVLLQVMDTSRILVIGDLHAPFQHPKYLEHCKAVKKHYKTTHTILIGDVMDANFSSFHEINPDGWGAGDELDKTIEELDKWHRAFIGADVIWGNHDRMAMRKVMSSGLSQRWLRGINDVLDVPSWNFHMKRVHDNVLYIHGEGVTARTKALRSGRSVVQGHRHTESYVWYNPKDYGSQFGMQVGCGINPDAYAFAYAKDHPAPVISCGVVLDHGKMAHVIPMSYGDKNM